MGTPVVVVNSAQAANDLFEKRSAMYSDRSVNILPHPYVTEHHFAVFQDRRGYDERIVMPDFHSLLTNTDSSYALLRLGWSFNIAFMPYGDRWRDSRRAFHQYYNSNQIPNYHWRVTKGVRELLVQLSDDPDHFIDHVRQ